MAGDSDKSSSPPNKRLKTLESKFEFEEDPTPQGPQETKNSPSESCAVCFLDNGKAIRGKMDCCDHYFCFLCIMEWSKIESRCPLCRRRFTTIRRPPKDGVFARERVVKVPVRDQVYLPFGNTAGDVRSYEQVRCNMCHGSTHEHLLLLCDLCDSAAHTYCVGLGMAVPEGDWFCLDCIASRAEHHANVDVDDGNIIPTALPSFSGCNIQQGSSRHSTEVDIPILRIIPVSNLSSDFPPPAVPDRCTISVVNDVTSPARTLPIVPDRPTESVARTLPRVSDRPTESVARTPPSVLNRPTESVARTLDRCRNVQSRIQEFRKNWNAFRNGSLSFPSGSLKSGCSSSQKHNKGVVFHERSGETQSSTSTSRLQPENRGSCGSYDIDKAWKMMDKAMSRQHAHKKSSSAVQFSKLPCNRTSVSTKRSNVNPCLGASVHAQSSSSVGCQQTRNQVGCGSHDIDKACKIMDTIKLKQHVHRRTSSGIHHPKLLDRKASASEEATNANLSVDNLQSQVQIGVSNMVGTGLDAYKCNSREKETIRHQSVKLEKERQSRVKAQEAVESSKGLSTSHSTGLFESPFSRNLSRSTLLQRSRKKTSNKVIDELNGSACSINEGASSFVYAKPELNTPSSIELDAQKRNFGRAESCVESKGRKDDDAKSEIQSLVKINLKLLSKDKQLGVHAFKEIARLSTHTILAACGLELPKYGMYSFPSLVCCHTEQFQWPHKSNLMPKSCRACFCGFVEAVVSQIICDLVGSAKLS